MPTARAVKRGRASNWSFGRRNLRKDGMCRRDSARRKNTELRAFAPLWQSSSNLSRDEFISKVRARAKIHPRRRHLSGQPVATAHGAMRIFRLGIFSKIRRHFPRAIFRVSRLRRFPNRVVVAGTIFAHERFAHRHAPDQRHAPARRRPDARRATRLRIADQREGTRRTRDDHRFAAE